MQVPKEYRITPPPIEAVKVSHFTLHQWFYLMASFMFIIAAAFRISGVVDATSIAICFGLAMMCVGTIVKGN